MWWVVIILLISCSSAAGATAKINRVQKQRIIRTTKTVEPVKPDPALQGKLVYAKGEGAVASAAKEPNRAKAYLDARNHAVLQATANLLMALDGTNIAYSATGRNFSANEEISQRIEGFARNVRVVNEREKRLGGDRIIEVTVAAPAGSAGPSSITKNELEQVVIETNEIIEGDVPPPSKQVTARPARVFSAAGYTSLIIDASGPGLYRSMSPKIRRKDGSEVWGTLNASYTLVQEEGIVGYARTLDEALASHRAGPRPLVIRAVGAAGGAFSCDPIVSDGDAQKILDANRNSGFLDTFNVVFVTGTAHEARYLAGALR